MSTSLQKIDVVFLTNLCEYLLNGEPVFVIRAQDEIALEILEEYKQRAFSRGATNLSRIHRSIDKIRKWQDNHLAHLKVPD